MIVDHSVQQLREHLERLAPEDDARARIAQRMERAIITSSHGEVPLPHRRRAPRITVGAVVVTAACIGMAVALAPWRGDGPRGIDRFVGPDTAVARELVRAGDAARDAQWGPLADGEYYHLYSTSIPGSDEGSGRGPSSTETWMNREGSGQSLSVIGSVDPDRYPTISKHGGGMSNSIQPATRAVSLEEKLAKPNSVNLMVWSGQGLPGVQRAWIRTPEGFRKTYDSDTASGRMHDPTVTVDAEAKMRQAWGITTTQIDALPAEPGPDMDAAIEALISDPPYPEYRVPTGAFGETGAQMEQEVRIQNAVMLLGRAPLPPEARRALYRWLAGQPQAKLERGVVDAIGRSGVRVSFEHTYRQEVSARTVTVGQLLEEANSAGGDVDPDATVTMRRVPSAKARRSVDPEQPVDANEQIEVPKHIEARTWRASFIVDPETGELLQQELHAEKGAGVPVPQVVRAPGGQVRIIFNSSSGRWSEIMGGSDLFGARGRATLEEATSPVCASAPELCQR